MQNEVRFSQFLQFSSWLTKFLCMIRYPRLGKLGVRLLGSCFCLTQVLSLRLFWNLNFIFWCISSKVSFIRKHKNFVHKRIQVLKKWITFFFSFKNIDFREKCQNLPFETVYKWKLTAFWHISEVIFIYKYHTLSGNFSHILK